MSVYAALPALVGVALLGWLGGMLTFKRSLLWCKRCGDVLRCPSCTRAESHRVAASGRAQPRNSGPWSRWRADAS